MQVVTMRRAGAGTIFQNQSAQALTVADQAQDLNLAVPIILPNAVDVLLNFRTVDYIALR